MEFSPTSLPGCFLLRPRLLRDERGVFIKTFQGPLFRERGLECSWEEQYHSVSRKGVLRGLHFQVPPADHAKLVTCLEGEILDAVVDLRVGSPAFGRHELFQLGGGEMAALYIPRGIAHGFLVLSPSALVFYSVGSAYSPPHDSGIRWDSAGIPWPGPAPLVSARDRALPPLAGFSSPFVFAGASGSEG
jgi:dTDP-4-dehydrorhamnose 3,5-epimerase